VGANPTRGVCFSGGTVDTADLESAALKSVEVQIFSGALDNQTLIVYDCHISGYGVAVTRHPSKLESPVRTRLPALGSRYADSIERRQWEK
jgi:hypothetical protein